MNRTPDWGQAPPTHSTPRYRDVQQPGARIPGQGDAGTAGVGLPAGGPPSGGVPLGAAPQAGVALPTGYQMLRQVGTGRFATVYLCREEATGQEAAVKLVNTVVQGSGKRLSAHSELLAAGAAARHPCSVTVEDAGFTAEKRPYVITGFCRGGNAQAKLMASGPFPVEDVLVIGVRAVLALHASHRRGVLHLDVRPANILFDDAGDALLSDHGVARVLQRCAPELGAVFDPMFSAREMFGWEAPGPAADVYSLGATLYALLTGEPAYADAGRTGWAALYGEILKGELPRLPRPDVPDHLAVLLQRMMSAHPENRPPLTEVHRVLRMLLPVAYSARVPDLDPEPGPVLPLPGWDPAKDALIDEERDEESVSAQAEAELKHRNRNRLIAGAAVLVVFAGAATAAVLLTQDDEGGKPKAEKPSASASTAAPQDPTAQQVPERDLPSFRPTEVRVAGTGNSVQITWQPPENAGAAAGYLVTAVTPEGDVLSTKNAAKDERQVVFTSPPVQDDSCFVVTTLVGTETDSLQVAPSKPYCRKD